MSLGRPSSASGWRLGAERIALVAVPSYAAHVQTSQHQASLRERMISGKASQLEVLAFHYALGRPRQQVTVAAEDSLAETLRMAHDLNDERRRVAPGEVS